MAFPAAAFLSLFRTHRLSGISSSHNLHFKHFSVSNPIPLSASCFIFHSAALMIWFQPALTCNSALWPMQTFKCLPDILVPFKTSVDCYIFDCSMLHFRKNVLAWLFPEAGIQLEEGNFLKLFEQFAKESKKFH